MSLDQEALRQACRDIARTTMWAPQPQDVATFETLASRLYEIAFRAADSVPSNRDQNLVLRAVQYLDRTHAIPPMGDDTEWFSSMLRALVALACPDMMTREFVRFHADIAMGLADAWADDVKVDE